MRNTRKIFVALLVVMTLLMSMAVVASAAKTTGDTTIYLTPGDLWKSDDARFALYTWDVSTQWYDMSDSDGDGVYECVIPAGIENIIFCRMNPDSSANGWGSDVMWNQTVDLKYDGTNNHCTITDHWGENNSEKKASGTWSLLETGECIHSPTDEGTVITAATCTENGEVKHVCVKCQEEYTAALLATGHTYGADGKCSCGAEVIYIIAGDVMQVGSAYVTGVNFLGTSWDATDEANKLEYNEELGCFAKVYENVSVGEYHFKITVDKSWNLAYGADGATAGGSDNCYINVTTEGSTVTILFKDGVPSATVTTNSDTPVDPDPETVYVVAGDVMQVDGVYAEGVNFFGSVWDVTDENNVLVYDEELGCYVKVYTDVFAGEYQFKIAENMEWTVSYGENGGTDNCYVNVTEDGSTVTIIFKDGIPSATVTAPESPEDPEPTPDPTPDDTTDPDDTPDPEPTPDTDTPTDSEEPEELTLIQKILKAVADFFKNIGGWFKNLLGGLKK